MMLQASLPAPVVPAAELRLAVMTALARLNLTREELTVQIHWTRNCSAMVMYLHLLYASVFLKTLVLENPEQCSVALQDAPARLW